MHCGAGKVDWICCMQDMATHKVDLMDVQSPEVRLEMQRPVAARGWPVANDMHT